MKLIKTVYNSRLLSPDSYTVECGNKKARFQKGEEKAVGDWVRGIWAKSVFKEPAYIYYNIGWDCDHVLYCKYECEFDWADFGLGEASA